MSLEQPGQPKGAANAFGEFFDLQQAAVGPEESARIDRLFLDAIPYPAVLVRSDRTIMVANRVAAGIGAKPGQPCWREFCKSLFVLNGNEKCWFCLADEALRENAEKKREVEALGRIWEVTWLPARDGIYLHYSFDITRRKRIEEALLRSEARLAEAQKLAHLGNWERDLDTNEITWSEEVYNIIGIGPVGRRLTFEDVLVLIHPEDRHLVQRSVWGCLYADKKFDVEYRVIRPDRTVRFLHSRAGLVRDGNGKAKKLIGTVQDITERKRVELELTRINQFKSEIITNVSHELKSPLASIKGAISSLLQKDIMLDDATRETLLNGISEETDRLNRLVSNLLNLSKLEAGVWVPERRPCQVADIIRDVKKHQRWAHKNRAFVARLQPDLPEVAADHVQIKQVLINLVENALAYSDESQPVCIEATAIDGAIEVAVADRGAGIPAQDLDRIFEKFVRGAPKDSRSGGVGLGLAICRSIISAHGGKIWAESEVGRGSTFHFTLPV
ncbi:MAG: PAS domain-containing protein [Chloroflexi bacterium]|nr:PAS domain-containing protein [Chloroflexota bacterium]